MSYYKKTLQGFKWITILRITTRIMAFVRIVILARLLSPYQFGLYGIASFTLAFTEMFTETGINVFFIQKTGSINKYLNTAWVISITRGIIISLLIFLSSPLLSSFFKQEESINLIRLISLVPLLKGFINPAIVRYQKELRFYNEFIFRFIIFTTDSLIAILIGIITNSAYSLVTGLITGAVVEIILSWIFISPRPKFLINMLQFKDIIKRGKWVTLYGIFNYAFENIDDMLVGKIIGISALGIYQNAYKISTLPISEISEVFIKVTFPIFSKIADKDQLKKIYLKTVYLPILLIVLVGIIILLFSSNIVNLLLGKQWLEAVPIIRILVFLGIIRGISHPSYSLLLALKRQDVVMYCTLFNLLIVIATIYPLIIKFGVYGAASSVLISSIMTLVVIIIYIHSILRKQYGL